MKCKNPYTGAPGRLAYPCGQCLPCRFNRRRVWTHRIMLEADQHVDNCFLTLTYKPPVYGPEDMSLRPRDLQLFLKRLRKKVSPHRFRFYACGEYGERNYRPHFHIALFGLPTCRFGKSRYSNLVKDCCDVCTLYREVWGKGFAYLGKLEPESAQYVAGYVSKKIMSRDDPNLKGRFKEFSRMSLRPAVGLMAMHDVASVLLQHNIVSPEGDVPSALRHGKKLMPLGRYLRKKLRTMVGHDEKAPPITILQMEALLHDVWKGSVHNPENKEATEGLKAVLRKASVQEHRNFDAKYQLFQKRKAL